MFSQRQKADGQSGNFIGVLLLFCVRLSIFCLLKADVLRAFAKIVCNVVLASEAADFLERDLSLENRDNVAQLPRPQLSSFDQPLSF